MSDKNDDFDIETGFNECDYTINKRVEKPAT
jgi:hypothetical protein